MSAALVWYLVGFASGAVTVALMLTVWVLVAAAQIGGAVHE
ncbi:hypothetical protein [Gordonia sp. CPCC 205333]